MSTHIGQTAVGDCYGRWTVIRKLGAGYVSECICSCGVVVERLDSILIKGAPGSGGCINCRTDRSGTQQHAELRAEYFRRYFEVPSDDFRSLLGKVEWAISRCHDENDKDYGYYGERGIQVCEEWREDPIAFVRYLAVLPRDSERRLLDRIDNDGDYAPGNVRFATKSEQCRNKRNPGKSDSERKIMLTPEMERVIKRSFSRGATKAELASLYCVRITTICSVLENRER